MEKEDRINFEEILNNAKELDDFDVEEYLQYAKKEAYDMYSTEVGLANILYDTEIEMADSLFFEECARYTTSDELYNVNSNVNSNVNNTNLEFYNDEEVSNDNVMCVELCYQEDKNCDNEKDLESCYNEQADYNKNHTVIDICSDMEVVEDGLDNEMLETEQINYKTNYEGDKVVNGYDDDKKNMNMFQKGASKVKEFFKNWKNKRKEMTDEDKDEEVDNVLSYVKIILVALVVALFINNFIISNVVVPTGSMIPTINEKDRLFGNRLAYSFGNSPERGDIIIFKFPDDESKRYIKRVIGLPGETVVITDGVLYIDGKELDESDYLKVDMEGTFGPYVVPEDSYFVLGDNRNASIDSRKWNKKFVSKDAIIAKAVVKYFPKFEKVEDVEY